MMINSSIQPKYIFKFTQMSVKWKTTCLSSHRTLFDLYINELTVKSYPHYKDFADAIGIYLNTLYSS